MADSGRQKRSRDQIENNLLKSKLKLSEILPVTQIVYNCEKNTEEDYFRLLELDKHLLESLEIGQKVSFKGDDDDNVILCTENRTYDIKDCETSNSLILVDNLKFFNDIKTDEEQKIIEVIITGTNYKYLEILPCKPHLGKLVSLLESTKYEGPEKEYLFQDEKLLTYEELLDLTQASDKEFQTALKKMYVLTINNKMRMLDFQYQFRVVSFMLRSIEENSWALDEIVKSETVSAWKELVPEEILKQIFEMYTSTSKLLNDVQLYKYDERKICQFLASVLLMHATRFSLNDFLQAWNDSVPEGMVPTEDMLLGMAIIDRMQEPHSIWAFPEHKLPDTISGRFEALFKAKSKWTVKEITPYVECLTSDKLDSNAVLAKHARASNIDGVRFYSAKYI